MKITKASIEELKAILSMYQLAKKDLDENNIHQWDQQDPSQQTIKEDIKKGNLYVAKKGETILGSIVLDEEMEPEHQQVKWLVPIQSALYLHRLVVHPNYQGEGTGKALMKFADEYAKKHGYTSIRLDAYEENEIARNLYRQFGYKQAGKVYFPRREAPFICYEKPLI